MSEDKLRAIWAEMDPRTKYSMLPENSKKLLHERAGSDREKIKVLLNLFDPNFLEEHQKNVLLGNSNPQGLGTMQFYAPDEPENTGQYPIPGQEKAESGTEMYSDKTRAAMKEVALPDFQDPIPNIPGFTIKKQLGKGAMGAVYLATEEDLGREVAVKTSLYPDEDLEKMLVRETTTHAALEHQNIAPIFRTGTFENEQGQRLIYYTMKVVPGITLDEAIKKDKLDEKEKIEAIAKVADALAYAHKKNIIHRDLKPENVMIGPEGLFVMDFGLAKKTMDFTKAIDPGAAPEGDVDISQPGDLKGTPLYFAPEQAMGEATPKSDVYALGEILYESLTGKKFREGEFGGLAGLLIAINQGLAGSDEGYAMISKELQSVIRAATAYEASDRPPAEEVAANLRAYLRGETVPHHNYTFAEKAGRIFRKHGAKVAAGLLTLTLGLAGAAGGLSLKARAEMAEKEKAVASERAMKAEKEKAVASTRAYEAEQKARNAKLNAYVSELEAKINQRDWEDASALFERVRGAGFEDKEQLEEWNKTIGGWTPVKVNAPEGFNYRIRKIDSDKEQNFEGTSELSLTPGSYLLEGEQGYRDLFVVRRGQQLEEKVELAEQIPGFIWVPSGESTMQEKPFGERKAVEIPGFYIAERHITFGEYYDFLNSPELNNGKLDFVFKAAGVKKEQIPQVMQIIKPTLMMPARGNVRFNEHEIAKLGITREHPVAGITVLGAELYAQWKNLSDDKVKYSLPTEMQVRRAYGELSGQRFPWGNETNRKLMITAEEMNNSGLFGNMLLVEKDNVPESWTGMKLGNIRDAIKAGDLYAVYGIGIRPDREKPYEHPLEVSPMNFGYPNSTMGIRLAAERR